MTKDDTPCGRDVEPGRNACALHGGKGGRPVIHGRRSSMPAKWQAIYDRNVRDNTLMDLVSGLAALETMVEVEITRLAGQEEHDPEDVERIHRMLDKNQIRREAYWSLKLKAERVINAEDLVAYLVRLRTVVADNAPNEAWAAKLLGAIDRDIAKILAEEAKPVDSEQPEAA
jgi:hypothetical protein